MFYPNNLARKGLKSWVQSQASYWVSSVRTLDKIDRVITLRPRQNGRHFANDIFKWVWIPNKISLKFVPQGPINNIQALVQIMAWRRPGDKPLSGPMMVRLPTHICVTRPQWVITVPHCILQMGQRYDKQRQGNKEGFQGQVFWRNFDNQKMF